MKFFFKKRCKKNTICDKKKRRKKLTILILIIICLSGLIIFFRTNITNVVYSYSESKVRALSIKAVNNAVSELVTNKNIYDNLVNITTDNEGKIKLIQANSIQINMLTKDLIKTSQIKLEKIGEIGRAHV